MATNWSPFEGIAELIASTPLPALQSAGGAKAVKVDGELTTVGSKNFDAVFRTRAKELTVPGTLYIVQLHQKIDGTALRKLLEERKATDVALKQLFAALQLHASGKAVLLSEEVDIRNRCFCKNARGTVYAVELARTAPGRWCFSTPDPHEPKNLGGIWPKGTFVLTLDPDKK